jgi:hypothetical protein
MEMAQRVLDDSCLLAAGAGPQDLAEVSVRLLRSAGHDDSTLRHAVRIGRTRLRKEPVDPATERAVDLLESVIAFLGAKPRSNDTSATH